MIIVQPINVLQTSPPLCDFEQWIDTEIKEYDKRYLELCKKWEAEDLERLEKRRLEEAAEKERQEEIERRLLNEGRRGRGSLSVLAVLKPHWRTIQMY